MFFRLREVKSLLSLSPSSFCLLTLPPPFHPPPPRVPIPPTPGHRDRDARILKCNKPQKNPGESAAQQVRNTATSYNTISYTALADSVRVNTTHRRFYEGQSAYFSICKTQQDLLLAHLATTTFRHHEWRHFSLGKVKRVGNERRSPGKISIHSENRQIKHSTSPLLVQKCKYPVTITVRARANLTNHGPRRCPRDVYVRLGRGGRGYENHVLPWSGADDVTLRENKIQSLIPSR